MSIVKNRPLERKEERFQQGPDTDLTSTVLNHPFSYLKNITVITHSPARSFSHNSLFSHGGSHGGGLWWARLTLDFPRSFSNSNHSENDALKTQFRVLSFHASFGAINQNMITGQSHSGRAPPRFSSEYVAAPLCVAAKVL